MTPEEVIAQALHDHACLSPADCRAAPSPEQREAAYAVSEALRQGGYVHSRVDSPPVDLLGVLWLYVSWHSATKHLTTEQKELWADVVEVWSTRMGDEPARPDRWWRNT